MKSVVHVDVSRLLTPADPLSFDYAILCNRPADWVVRFADDHPRCFVFVFATGAVGDAPDYSGVDREMVVKPLYVGNLQPVRNAIGLYVTMALSAFPDAIMNCILDETP